MTFNRTEAINFYIESVIDCMTTKDLICFVSEAIYESLEKLSDEKLQEELKEL